MILPEKFEELTGKQFIELAPMLYSGGEEVECNVKALKILSGISSFRWAMLKPDVINKCIEFVGWIFNDAKITKQLLPCYKGYHGPTSSFDNLRMKEFHLSEIYYKQLVRTENEAEAIEHINNLVAVLYRLPRINYDVKRDPDGDIRVDFNHNEIPFHSSRIARWPLKVKQAIFLWYASCRQELEDNNPMVFKEDSKNSFASQFDTGLYGMMRNLAGEKLGSVEKIENMYVLQAMLEIGLIKEEEIYFEEQMKARK